MVSPVDLAAAFAVGIGQTVIKPVRPEPGPATQRWGVGVGEAAARLPLMPGPVRGLARRIGNRFGSVAVSPGGIEFDGDEVAWSKVTEIRTRRREAAARATAEQSPGPQSVEDKLADRYGRRR